MRILYDATVPTEFIPIINERINPVFEYFPGWVQEVVIYYSAVNPSNATLACKANYIYRYVELYVYADWFHPNEDGQWTIPLWHELMHVVFSPYTYVAERAITLFEEGALKEHIKQELVDAEEFVAQDFAQLINNLTTPK